MQRESQGGSAAGQWRFAMGRHTRRPYSPCGKPVPSNQPLNLVSFGWLIAAPTERKLTFAAINER